MMQHWIVITRKIKLNKSIAAYTCKLSLYIFQFIRIYQSKLFQETAYSSFEQIKVI
jgi:hypothetical protein